MVAWAHLEGGARVPLPASRCAGTSFRLRQVDEVQAETSARMFRDGTYGPPLCFCPAPEVEDNGATDAEHLVRGPQQAAFKDVSLAVSAGFTPKSGIIHSSGVNRTALSSCAILRARVVLPTPGRPTVKCSVGVSVIPASLTPSPIKDTHIGMPQGSAIHRRARYRSFTICGPSVPSLCRQTFRRGRGHLQRCQSGPYTSLRIASATCSNRSSARPSSWTANAADLTTPTSRPHVCTFRVWASAVAVLPVSRVPTWPISAKVGSGGSDGSRSWNSTTARLGRWWADTAACEMPTLRSTMRSVRAPIQARCGWWKHTRRPRPAAHWWSLDSWHSALRSQSSCSMCWAEGRRIP